MGERKFWKLILINQDRFEPRSNIWKLVMMARGVVMGNKLERKITTLGKITAKYCWKNDTSGEERERKGQRVI